MSSSSDLRISKDTQDVVRVKVGFANQPDMDLTLDWLDSGEDILSIQSQSVAMDDSMWVLIQPLVPPIVDTTPLAIQSATLAPGATEVDLFLESGTPGISYVVKFVVLGRSNRELTVRIGVQIDGDPPIVTTQPPLLSDGAISRLGDSMEGRLFLAFDPLDRLEAATKNYVDATRRTLEAEFTGQIPDVTDPITAALNAEIAARIAADNVEATARANADTAEATARAAAVSNETTARQAADTAINVAIFTETSARIAGDNANNIAISNEGTARTSADATLQANINAEAATRLANDNALTTSIASEAMTRANSDATLNAADVAEANARAAQDVVLLNTISATQIVGLKVYSGTATTNGGALAAVTYPAPFSSRPHVVVSISGVPAFGGVIYLVNSSGENNGGFSATTTDIAGAAAPTVEFSWIAIGAQ